MKKTTGYHQKEYFEKCLENVRPVLQRMRHIKGCDSFLLKVFAFIKIKGSKRLLFPFKNE